MSSSSSVLGAGVGDDLFENFKRLWGGGDKAGDNSKESNLLPSDDEAAGTTLIASIPGTYTAPCMRCIHQFLLRTAA